MTRLLPAALVLATLACARAGTPEQQAIAACRELASRHLVDPVSAEFSELEARHASGDATWEVLFRVRAKNGQGEALDERATCRLDERLGLIEITAR